jgi:hypothetical protein
MMDESMGGKRFRTVRPVMHHGGLVPRETAGTIRYALENIGRTLLRVDLDSGASMMLLPDDVAFDSGEAD